MAYEVVKSFRDIQDKERKYYHAGDTYPHDGVSPSDERIKELSTTANRRKKVLIREVNETEPEHIGGGYYKLSNGEKVQGKEKAAAAEQALHE